MTDDFLNDIIPGDFVQLALDGDYLPVSRVRWDGVDYIDVRANLETRFAPYDAIIAVVPNDEIRGEMFGDSW
jgi:hypothetical protein